MSSLITSVAMKEFGDAGVGIATAFATLIILIFGEILPNPSRFSARSRSRSRFRSPSRSFPR
jgi:Mg2+/Co2+ transporter CorB